VLFIIFVQPKKDHWMFEGLASSPLQYESTFYSLSEQRGSFGCVQRVCSVTTSVLLVLCLEKLAKTFSKRVIYFQRATNAPSSHFCDLQDQPRVANTPEALRNSSNQHLKPDLLLARSTRQSGHAPTRLLPAHLPRINS